MKKILTLAVIVTMTLAACANEQMIQFSELPVLAQNFIQKHYSTSDVSYIEKDRDVLTNEYKLYLKDRTEIEFDHQGNLQSIDCHQTAVPQEIMPSIITDYVRLHHPNLIIVEYQVDMRHQKVGLSNDWELVFDHNGNFLGMDD